jgi:hypothetical protein
LRTVTHNLVIIRFDWESSNRYLLPVYHRLCLVLADVLYAHHMFAQWHERMVKEYESAQCTEGEEDSKEEKSENADVRSLQKSVRPNRLTLIETIQRKWLDNRLILWKRCEEVLIKCLDEYLHFASHKSLFQKPAQLDPNSSGNFDESSSSYGTSSQCDTGGSPWRNDLEGLHSVLILTEQFMSVKDTLFGKQMRDDNRSRIDGDLREKLCDVFRKNLRNVHVEAMKSLGMRLSQESWGLQSSKQLSEYGASTSLQEVRVETFETD